MKIEAYTLPGCPSCNHLKELFRRAEVDYKEIIIRRDLSKESFSEKYPAVKGFPFVVIDDSPVGGLVETVKLFVKEGLVSSNKKE
jgi:glutaredoxin